MKSIQKIPGERRNAHPPADEWPTPLRIRRVRYGHWIFRLPLMRRYRGMVLGRTVLFKGGESEISPAMLRHELVHIEQIDRHGVARFYFIYFCDYLANLWRLRNHDAAYRSIPFEKEAYERERR